MRAKLEWAVLSVAALALAAAAVPAAGEGGISHEELMHDVQTARTRADHEEIALIYEKQASADLAAAEDHRRMASQYNRFDPSRVDRSTLKTMAIHCHNLVELYTGAAKEHSALGRAASRSRPLTQVPQGRRAILRTSFVSSMTTNGTLPAATLIAQSNGLNGPI